METMDILIRFTPYVSYGIAFTLMIIILFEVIELSHKVDRLNEKTDKILEILSKDKKEN